MLLEIPKVSFLDHMVLVASECGDGLFTAQCVANADESLDEMLAAEERFSMYACELVFGAYSLF